MTDDVRSALHDLAASADLSPLQPNELVGRAVARRRRRRVAAGSAAAAVLLAAPVAWSALPARHDTVVEDRAVDTDDRTVAVGRAELTVPEGWEVVELAPGEPEGCDLALDQFASPRLYVARGAIGSVVPPCSVDATGSSTAGGVAVPLTGSRLEGSRDDEGGRPISVNGIDGVVHVDLMNMVYDRPGEDLREQVEIRTYVFRSVDVALRLRVDPAPQHVEELVESLRATGPLLPPSPSPEPPAPPPADAGPLPPTLAAIASDEFALRRLDPLSGEPGALLVDERGLGEGAQDVTLTPDGRTVYYSRAVTGCSGEIVRVSVDGGAAEPVAPGARPAVSPDGTRLAYASDPGCGGELAELSVRDLGTGVEWSSSLTAQPDEWIGLRAVTWSSDGRSVAVLVSYSGRDGGRRLPERTELRIVDVAGGGTLQDSSPLPLPGATTLAWRGERDTLLAATAEAVVELDSATGRVLQQLVPVDREVISLASDVSGNHLLYVLMVPKEPGVRGARVTLYRWSGGQPVVLREDVSSADW